MIGRNGLSSRGWRRPSWLKWGALSYLAGLILSFILGVLCSMNRPSTVNPQTVSKGLKPAYLVASWDVLHPDQLKPFIDAAVPLARRAGFEPIAAGTPEVLEGAWPNKGVVIVQKYTSMRALEAFWRSPEHTGAKRLRKGLVDSHFVIAIEGE
jgi:uncharacterized protein (DUF1330 family)